MGLKSLLGTPQGVLVAIVIMFVTIAITMGSVPQEQRQHDVEVLSQLTPSTGRKSIQSSAFVGK